MNCEIYLSHERSARRIGAATGLRRLGLSCVLVVLLGVQAEAQEKRTLTYVDLMQVRQIENPTISSDGRWVVFTAKPDRGDGEVIVRSRDGAVRHVVPLGSAPVISNDGRRVAMRLVPSFEAMESAKDAKPDEKPRTGLALLATDDGEVMTWEEVESFDLSSDGAWLVRHHFERDDEDEGEQGEAEQETEGEEERERDESGTLLVLRDLDSGRETEIEYASAYAFHERGRYLAYVVAAPDGAGDGLYLVDLSEDASSAVPLDTAAFNHIEALAWWEEGPALAWVSAIENEAGETGAGSLRIWVGGQVKTVVAIDESPDGWTLPTENTLRWSEDGERLFFGYRPAYSDKESGGSAEVGVEEEGSEAAEAGAEAQGGEAGAFDPYDLDAILADRGVDVWHTEDPLINPNQKRQWDRQEDRTYAAVYHVDDGQWIQLADTLVQLRGYPRNERGSVRCRTCTWWT